MQIDLFLGVLSFTGVVLLLVAIIIAARSQLVSSGDVTIEINCLLYTSPSPRDATLSRMPSSA